MNFIKILLFSSVFMASQANAVTITEAKPVGDYAPIWKSEGVKFSFSYYCRVSGKLFSAKRSCQFPQVNVKGDYTGKVSLKLSDESNARDLGYAYSIELASALIDDPEAIIYVNGKPFILLEFESRSRNWIKASENVANKEVGSERLAASFLVIAALALLLFTWKVLIPSIKKASFRVASKVSERSERIKDKAESKAIQRIAEEEAIRASVRKTIDLAESKDVEAINAEIANALTSGDTKTAKALIATIEALKNK